MNFRDGQLHWSMYTRFVDGEEAAPTAAHLHFGAAGMPLLATMLNGLIADGIVTLQVPTAP